MGTVSRTEPTPAPSPRGFGRGTSSVSARRHRVVWSGTARSSPSRPMTEPIRPSVCWYASRNTALNVSAVRIARSEYSDCPPRLVRRSASHASTASSENQIVKLPRRRRLSSYSRQFVTLRFCSGMWWRRSRFSLKGKADIPGQTEGCPATSIGPRVLPVGSLQQRDARALAPAPDLVEKGLKLRSHLLKAEEVARKRVLGSDRLADGVSADRAGVHNARDGMEVRAGFAEVLLQNREGLRLQVSPGPDGEPVHPGLGCRADAVKAADRQSLDKARPDARGDHEQAIRLVLVGGELGQELVVAHPGRGGQACLGPDPGSDLVRNLRG